MAGRLAILACDGALPVAIAAANPEAMVITLRGVPSPLEAQSERHRFEQLGALFGAMRAGDVGRIVFSGALVRPQLDLSALDETTKSLAPRLMAAVQKGDDRLLRTVIEVFEDQGFAVVGAHEVLPELVAEDGLAVGPEPEAVELADAARAVEILKGIAPLDIGQGCVVAGGQCLGIETVQGTDALLRFVAETEPRYRRGFRGVYVKAAKAGQDLRIDMPAIGPRTVAAVAGAGLAGVIVEAGRVMVLERDVTLEAARGAGIFLRAQAL